MFVLVNVIFSLGWSVTGDYIFKFLPSVNSPVKSQLSGYLSWFSYANPVFHFVSVSAFFGAVE